LLEPVSEKLAAMKVALFALVAGAAALDLNSGNWDSATAGKQVFVKFLAPW